MRLTLIVLITLLFCELSSAQIELDTCFVAAFPDGENKICSNNGNLEYYFIKQDSIVVEYAEYYNNGTLKYYATNYDDGRANIILENLISGEIGYYAKHNFEGMIEIISYSKKEKAKYYWKRESPFIDTFPCVFFKEDSLFTDMYLWYCEEYNRKDELIRQGYKYVDTIANEYIDLEKMLEATGNKLDYDSITFPKMTIPKINDINVPQKIYDIAVCDCEDFESKREKTFEWGLGAFFGQSNPLVKGGSNLKLRTGGGFTLRFSYADFYLTGMYKKLSKYELESDFEGLEYLKKGNQYSTSFLEASLGYCIYNNHKYQVIPFVGVSGMKTSIGIEDNSDIVQYQTFPVFGLMLDRSQLPKAINNSYSFEKERRSSSHVTLSVMPFKLYDGPSGLMININYGINLGVRRYKMK